MNIKSHCCGRGRSTDTLRRVFSTASLFRCPDCKARVKWDPAIERVIRHPMPPGWLLVILTEEEQKWVNSHGSERQKIKDERKVPSRKVSRNLTEEGAHRMGTAGEVVVPKTIPGAVMDTGIYERGDGGVVDFDLRATGLPYATGQGKCRTDAWAYLTDHGRRVLTADAELSDGHRLPKDGGSTWALLVSDHIWIYSNHRVRDKEGLCDCHGVQVTPSDVFTADIIIPTMVNEHDPTAIYMPGFITLEDFLTHGFVLEGTEGNGLGHGDRFVVSHRHLRPISELLAMRVHVTG